MDGLPRIRRSHEARARRRWTSPHSRRLRWTETQAAVTERSGRRPAPGRRIPRAFGVRRRAPASVRGRAWPLHLRRPADTWTPSRRSELSYSYRSARLGSWRAARTAGSKPLTVLRTTATTSATPAMTTSVWNTSMPAPATLCANRSDDAAEQADDGRLGDEQQQYVTRPRAQCFQHTDLFGSLEHRAVHRVGDPETRQQQGDHRQCKECDAQTAQQVLEPAEQVAEALGLEAERGEAVAQAVDGPARIGEQGDVGELTALPAVVRGQSRPVVLGHRVRHHAARRARW